MAREVLRRFLCVAGVSPPFMGGFGERTLISLIAPVVRSCVRAGCCGIFVLTLFTAEFAATVRLRLVVHLLGLIQDSPMSARDRYEATTAEVAIM